MSSLLRLGLLFCGATLFFGVFCGQLPVTDPVEANYALTAKEMLQAGDWLSPRIYGQYWFDKPIMIYWLLLASYAILGVTDFAGRLPAVLFSAGSVVFCYWCAARMYRAERAGAYAAAMLATALQFWLLSRMIITDAVLFFFTAVTMMLAYIGLTEGRRGFLLTAYAAAALAVLTKGPVGLVLPGSILLFYAVLRYGKPGIAKLQLPLGLIVFFAIAAPWHLLMVKLHGDLFVNMFLGLHNYVRATVSEHPKDNVFYYYLVLFPVSLLPWTGVCVAGMVAAWRERRAESLFLLAWVAGFLLFYTAMATKYPTYVFPALFPAIVLGAAYLAQRDEVSRWLITGPALLLFGGLALASVFLPAYGSRLFTVGAIIGSVGCCFALWRLRNAKTLVAVVSGTTVVVILLLVQQVLIPVAANRSAKALVAELPADAAWVGSAGDYSTSAVFYTGKKIPRLVDDVVGTGAGSQVWAQKHTMPRETWQSFEQKNAVYIVAKTNDSRALQRNLSERNYEKLKQQGNYFLFQRSVQP